jgi:hypothetical protein
MEETYRYVEVYDFFLSTGKSLHAFAGVQTYYVICECPKITQPLQ